MNVIVLNAEARNVEVKVEVVTLGRFAETCVYGAFVTFYLPFLCFTFQDDVWSQLLLFPPPALLGLWSDLNHRR